MAATDASRGRESPRAGRPSSPSPSTSPSRALGACPSLDRSVSTPSNTSSLSTSSRSVSSTSEGSNGVTRRRGYMRPFAAPFADSAKNRDSVMSLGSIAHRQHYFARTGLLDGKGAQLQRKRKAALGEDSINTLDPDDETTFDGVLTGEPIEDSRFEDKENAEPAMLPPTVSTYRQRPIHSEPVPDLNCLRRELRESLDDADKALSEGRCAIRAAEDPAESPLSENQGFYEIQGLHILDILTLTIRAAKDYYTCHSRPEQIFAVKSEKDIKSDLYATMDVLKRMSNRDFRGGMRNEEQQAMRKWVDSIRDLLNKEEANEQQEKTMREQWVWLQGDWQGREREREYLFLQSIHIGGQALPEWTEPIDNQPSAFLKHVKTGLPLIHLHNELVKHSQRRFGQITTFHTDLNKPYRCADNLRYWLKAAELRWETKLTLDVMALVNESQDAVWEQLDRAIIKWSSAVRQELTAEWLASKEEKSVSEVEVQQRDM